MRKVQTKAKSKAVVAELPAVPGSVYDDGFYVGRLRVEAIEYALILPPKAKSEHAAVVWNDSEKSVAGALSFCDGHANTVAMAKAGSKVAQWALDHDMHIPALDELELLYRAFKPGTESNYCYARAGINVSALPPTYPYTPDFPEQTKLKVFKDGGAEAFAREWYWSSTQHVSGSDYAWMQYFYGGGQDYYLKVIKYRARAVRRIKI